MNLMDLRADSEKRVLALGYEFNPDLPLLEDIGGIRPQADIETRALILHALVAVSCGFSPRTAQQWLLHEGLTSSITPTEKDFLRDPTNAAPQFQAQVECLWTFAWALRKLEQLDFLSPCSDILITLYPDLKR